MRTMVLFYDPMVICPDGVKSAPHYVLPGCLALVIIYLQVIPRTQFPDILWGYLEARSRYPHSMSCARAWDTRAWCTAHHHRHAALLYDDGLHTCRRLNPSRIRTPRPIPSTCTWCHQEVNVPHHLTSVSGPFHGQVMPSGSQGTTAFTSGRYGIHFRRTTSERPDVYNHHPTRMCIDVRRCRSHGLLLWCFISTSRSL